MTWCVFPDLSLWNDLRKPGSYSSKPGSYSSKPGSYSSKPGPYFSKRGSCSSKPESCSSKPGSYFSKPGSYSSKPWSYSSKPGSCFWKFTPHYSPKFGDGPFHDKTRSGTYLKFQNSRKTSSSRLRVVHCWLSIQCPWLLMTAIVILEYQL